LIFLRRKI